MIRVVLRSAIRTLYSGLFVSFLASTTVHAQAPAPREQFSPPPSSLNTPTPPMTPAAMFSEAVRQAYNLGLTTGLQMQAKMWEMSQQMDATKQELADARAKCGEPCAPHPAQQPKQ